MQRRRGPAAALATIGVLFMLWFVGSAAPAHACSCAAPGSEADRDAAAGTIIYGRAIAVEDEVTDDGQVTGRTYTVRVERLEKGEITDPVRFRTGPSDGASCGVDLPLDVLYKLYPERDPEGGYTIGQCGGNRPATAADLQPPPETTTTATAATAGTSRSTSSTSRSSTTLTTVPPPTLPTTTSSFGLPTTGTTLPTDEAAVSIDDDNDDDGGGGLLQTVGVAAVAAVGGAALATWRARRVAVRPPEDWSDL